MVLSFQSMAHIETSNDNGPTEIEIAAARSCFEEIEILGCGSPKEDYPHFRACMHDIFPTLTPGCKKMVTGLYGKKK